jgi:hypothetical protein
MATAAKFVLQIQICLAYLVPLDVDVTGNITAKKCFIIPHFKIRHGNREHMSKSLTSLISKLPKGFPQDLSYILSRVGRIF